MSIKRQSFVYVKRLAHMLVKDAKVKINWFVKIPAAPIQSNTIL